MAGFSTVPRNCVGKWSSCSRPTSEQRFLCIALNSTFPNSLSLNSVVVPCSEYAGANVSTAGVVRQHQFCPASVSGIQLPHFSSSTAQCLKSRKKKAIEAHVCSRISLSLRGDGLKTSAVASGLVSPDGTCKSTRKEHVEQLEEFYLENEFLFIDETWGAPGQDGKCSSDMSALVQEKLSSVLVAGRLQRGSKVLVWGGSAAFARELCAAISPASLVVVHFSVSVLGAIKEFNDDVICWLGDVEDLPDSYGPFDCVFLNSIMTTAHSPAALLQGVTSRCKPGGRIVISYAQGRTDLDVGRVRNPQLIIQDLPDVAELQRMMKSMPVNVVGLQDEPSFYLATVEVEGTSRRLNSGSGPGELSGQQNFPLSARANVVQGFGRGSKQMGIPTANMNPEELPREFLDLPKGVYFGWAQHRNTDEVVDGGVYKMVMNVWNRPTFADGDGVTVEVHILHKFSSDFYGKQLSVIVLGFLRAEMQFKSLDELVQRIKADITTADKRLDDEEMLQYASDVFFDR